MGNFNQITQKKYLAACYKKQAQKKYSVCITCWTQERPPLMTQSRLNLSSEMKFISIQGDLAVFNLTENS